MSLEAIIEANTAAIKQLIGTLQLLNTPVILPGVELVAKTTIEMPVEEPAKPEPKKGKAKKEATVEARPLEPSAPSTGSGATDASATEAAVAPAVSRQDVSVALTMVSAKKGRDAAIEILKNVGAGSLKSAQESDYPAILCACELALS